MSFPGLQQSHWHPPVNASGTTSACGPMIRLMRPLPAASCAFARAGTQLHSNEGSTIIPRRIWTVDRVSWKAEPICFRMMEKARRHTSAYPLLTQGCVSRKCPGRIKNIQTSPGNRPWIYCRMSLSEQKAITYPSTHGSGRAGLWSRRCGASWDNGLRAGWELARALRTEMSYCCPLERGHTRRTFHPSLGRKVRKSSG